MGVPVGPGRCPVSGAEMCARVCVDWRVAACLYQYRNSHFAPVNAREATAVQQVRPLRSGADGGRPALFQSPI
jgi:hypothetical protein